MGVSSVLDDAAFACPTKKIPERTLDTHFQGFPSVCTAIALIDWPIMVNNEVDVDAVVLVSGCCDLAVNCGDVDDVVEFKLFCSHTAPPMWVLLLVFWINSVIVLFACVRKISLVKALVLTVFWRLFIL